MWVGCPFHLKLDVTGLIKIICFVFRDPFLFVPLPVELVPTYFECDL